MKETIHRIIALLLVCSSLLPLSLVGCGKKEGIYLASTINDMYAGETRFINVKTNKNTFASNLLYASSNPEVASVSEFGIIYAAEPGKTTIYIQSKDNKNWRLKFDLKVEYSLKDPSNVNTYATNPKYNGTNYKFWNANGYTTRSDNLLSVANVIITKDAQEYVFTELYDVGSIENVIAFQFSDWGNSDVLLQYNGVDSHIISQIVSKQYGINPGAINSKSAEEIADQLNKVICENINTLQSKVHISHLSNKYEYRVIVTVNCSMVETVNYYSRGLIDGITSVIGNITNMDSLLDSYTYSNNLYEIVDFTTSGIIIEQRIK